MKALNKPFAVVLFGSPGSGKSTQADLLSKKLNLLHFDTGAYLERAIFDPANQNKPIIQKIKKQWSTGEMSEPTFVLDIIRKYVHKFASQGDSLVFSGSPRTLYETKGDASHIGFIKILEKEYGKENVIYFELRVDESAAKKRNMGRLMCEVCGSPFLGMALKIKMKQCPFCGGKIYKRKLDDPKVIERRFEVYRNETKPIFAVIEKMGHKIYPVSAMAMPYKIFAALTKKIDSLLK